MNPIRRKIIVMRLLLGMAVLLLSLALTRCVRHVPIGSDPGADAPAATPMETVTEAVTATSGGADGTPLPVQPTEVPETVEPSATTVPPTETAAPTLSAEKWREWPVIPTGVSAKMKEVYAAGLEAGNRADRFSKVGDSNSTGQAFLGCYDFGELGSYQLDAYESLAATIKQFQWSFSRVSRATEIGKTAFDLDVYHWYEDDICWPYESATTCEYRLWTPSISFIALGTNDVFMKVDEFDKHMRSLVEKSLERFQVVPILATKADSLDPDGTFNQVIAQIALDYELPLWNLWRAMEPLPNHGLREDQVHPSAGSVSFCDFSESELETYGWPVRNLTALQALDAVYRGLTEP